MIGHGWCRSVQAYVSCNISGMLCNNLGVNLYSIKVFRLCGKGDTDPGKSMKGRIFLTFPCIAS